MTQHPPHTRGRKLIESAARRVETRHPPFVVSHPTATGWLWMAGAIVLLVVCDLTGGPGWLRSIIVIAATLPSLLATLIVLSQTPRTHLEYEESILTHFFARFIGLVGAFILWMGSVVIGAAIAVQLADDDGTNAGQSWVEAFDILAAVVPVISVLLWAVLIVRYVSYLVRLRGWSAVPVRHRIPEHFLAELPRTRQFIIGLAHPALLLVAGLLTTNLALVFILRAGLIPS